MEWLILFAFLALAIWSLLTLPDDIRNGTRALGRWWAEGARRGRRRRM